MNSLSVNVRSLYTPSPSTLKKYFDISVNHYAWHFLLRFFQYWQIFLSKILESPNLKCGESGHLWILRFLFHFQFNDKVSQGKKRRPFHFWKSLAWSEVDHYAKDTLWLFSLLVTWWTWIPDDVIFCIFLRRAITASKYSFTKHVEKILASGKFINN